MSNLKKQPLAKHKETIIDNRPQDTHQNPFMQLDPIFLKSGVYYTHSCTQAKLAL